MLDFAKQKSLLRPFLLGLALCFGVFSCSVGSGKQRGTGSDEGDSEDNSSTAQGHSKDPKQSKFYGDCKEICDLHPKLCGELRDADEENCLASCTDNFDTLVQGDGMESGTASNVELQRCTLALAKLQVCGMKLDCETSASFFEQLGEGPTPKECAAEMKNFKEQCGQFVPDSGSGSTWSSAWGTLTDSWDSGASSEASGSFTASNSASPSATSSNSASILASTDTDSGAGSTDPTDSGSDT